MSRKKTSRYIHSEREMDDYLLELGMSDLQMKLSQKAEWLSFEEMKQLVSTILDVENFILRIERKGIPFREFLALKNEQGQYPRFQVNLTEGAQFVYSEEEITSLRQADEEHQKRRHEQTLASIPVEEITDEMRIFKTARLHFMELYEEESLQKIEAELQAYELHFNHYMIANGALIEVKEEGDKVSVFYTLKEIIEFIRVNGRKGIEIQRYKGLGEMNADQLWETTMDPAKRTLIQVTLPDLIEAERMFTILMGDEVSPRRKFIEQHALSVKNLDL